MNMDFILHEKIIKTENKVLYSHITASEVADFHNKKHSKKTSAFLDSLDLLHAKKSGKEGANPKLPSINKINGYLQKHLDAKSSILLDVGGSNHQHRTGNTYQLFERYFPVNIDAPAIEKYSATFDRYALVSNAEELPIKDNSIDCIITNAFLEHPERPELILEELTRILKPGGLIVHNDAWFCRWWQRYGLVGFKSFSKMTFNEKVIYMLAKISEFPAIRFPPIIIRRFIREVFVGLDSPITLKYKKLIPNFELNLGADEHACSSIDPLDVIRFYESRGFIYEEKLSMIQRIFLKKHVIVLKKQT